MTAPRPGPGCGGRAESTLLVLSGAMGVLWALQWPGVNVGCAGLCCFKGPRAVGEEGTWRPAESCPALPTDAPPTHGCCCPHGSHPSALDVFFVDQKVRGLLGSSVTGWGPPYVCLNLSGARPLFSQVWTRCAGGRQRRARPWAWLHFALGHPPGLRLCAREHQGSAFPLQPSLRFSLLSWRLCPSALPM